ncbi:MAG: GtrA family protein [Pseudomonadota bacterium]
MQYIETAKTWLINFTATPGRIAQFLKYIAVSASALVVDVLTYGILIWAALTGAALAGAIGFSAGIITNYILAVNFVFDPGQTNKSNRQLFVEYATTGGVGIALTTSIIWVTVDGLGLHPALAKCLAVGPTFIVVYLIRAGVVFAPTRKAAPAH